MFSNIDNVAIFNDNICLCLTYSRSFLLKNRPKFEILNGFPCINCQSYLSMLIDLSMAKEATIAYTHPIISILKLMPSKVFNPVVYSCIKGYAILLLQNLAPLLILLSPTLVLYDVIYIVWAE